MASATFGGSVHRRLYNDCRLLRVVAFKLSFAGCARFLESACPACSPIVDALRFYLLGALLPWAGFALVLLRPMDSVSDYFRGGLLAVFGFAVVFSVEGVLALVFPALVRVIGLTRNTGEQVCHQCSC